MKTILVTLTLFLTQLSFGQNNTKDAKQYFLNYLDYKSQTKMVFNSLPTLEECNYIFKDEYAAMYFEYSKALKQKGYKKVKKNKRYKTNRVNTNCTIQAFNSSEIINDKNGEKYKLKDILKNNIQFYRVTYHNKKEDTKIGTRYSDFVNINGKWVFIQKFWEAFKDQLDSINVINMQKKLSDIIDSLNSGNASPSLFWELDSLIPKLINTPLQDVLNIKLNDNSRGASFSKKDGIDYHFFQKSADNKNLGYALFVWKKNDIITKISYYYPPNKHQDNIRYIDLKMFLNNVEHNPSFYGLQEIGGHIFFGRNKQKIMPQSYKTLLKKYLKSSNKEENTYEFLDWSGDAGSYRISISVNKISKQVRWDAVGKRY